MSGTPENPIETAEIEMEKMGTIIEQLSDSHLHKFVKGAWCKRHQMNHLNHRRNLDRCELTGFTVSAADTIALIGRVLFLVKSGQIEKIRPFVTKIGKRITEEMSRFGT